MRFEKRKEGALQKRGASQKRGQNKKWLDQKIALVQILVGFKRSVSLPPRFRGAALFRHSLLPDVGLFFVRQVLVPHQLFFVGEKRVLVPRILIKELNKSNDRVHTKQTNFLDKLIAGPDTPPLKRDVESFRVVDFDLNRFSFEFEIELQKKFQSTKDLTNRSSIDRTV